MKMIRKLSFELSLCLAFFNALPMESLVSLQSSRSSPIVHRSTGTETSQNQVRKVDQEKCAGEDEFWVMIYLRKRYHQLRVGTRRHKKRAAS